MKFSFTIAIIVLFICINFPVVYAQSTTDLLCQFDKNSMIRSKLSKAQGCIESGDYDGAKSYLNGVLNLDKNNIKAKQLLAICNNRRKSVQVVSTTLSVSTSSLSFAAVGGTENIQITTNASSYVIALLPNWCTITEYSNYIVVTCNKNLGNAARGDYFTVSAGDKSIRIYVNQAQSPNSEPIVKAEETNTLSLSKEYLYFESQGGKSEAINVYSNASTYSVSFLPSWCTVQSNNGYFTVLCNANYNSQARNDWFIVTAGDKEKKVYVIQKGLAVVNQSYNSYKRKTTVFYIGVGASYPLIVKENFMRFDNISYDFRIGLVKTIGLYAKIETNFKTQSFDYKIDNLPSDLYYKRVNDGESEYYSRLALVGGVMINTKPIGIYLGAGYGYYNHYIKANLYNYSSNSFMKTINLGSVNSTKGLETDAGLIFKINKVCFSAGVSSLEFNYYEANVDVGILF